MANLSNTGNTPTDGEWVVTRYITRNGKRIFPKNAKVFRFWVPRDKLR